MLALLAELGDKAPILCPTCLSPAAAMLAVMLPVVDTYLHNEKGVYVVQCLAANASNSELLAVARAVYSECLAVSKDPKGIFALIVLLEMLRDR